jgi:hypothetical protein
MAGLSVLGSLERRIKRWGRASRVDRAVSRNPLGMPNRIKESYAANNGIRQ